MLAWTGSDIGVAWERLDWDEQIRIRILDASGLPRGPSRAVGEEPGILVYDITPVLADSAPRAGPLLGPAVARLGSRVEFVLHPDGSVQNPRLLQSSRTTSLDKAALEAVKSIEPFTPAGNFIDRPEAYRVDVVFNVM